jgi:hypothetical protein
MEQQHTYPQNWPSFLDYVPVMSATVLGLEMILHEPHIDLSMASELVLSDIGATIKTFHMIGREYDFAEDRPNRIVDCLASLDVTAWFNAICSRLIPCDEQHSKTTAVWKHCRRVALYAQLVADSLDRIPSEDAYLVGLLHGFGSLPLILRWQDGDSDAGGADSLVAMERALPPFVLAALRSVRESDPSSDWRFILTAAHELAAPGKGFDSIARTESSSMGMSSH